jgi:hypothetical protein
MAIVFNCPHCLLEYRLSEKLAGKQAKCKNPECRKQITIPTPITIPGNDVPAPDSALVEAAALDALADEPPKQVEVPPEQKVISMTCQFCDHKWTEPWAKAGKNTLCPNPECRQRQKVPEPKEDVPTDWRQQKTKLPTLAKQNFEKLEGVQSAGEAQIVSRGALKEAGATNEEIEPRPLKEIAFFAGAGLAIVLGLIVGVWYLFSSRVESREHRLMADARTAFDKAAPDMVPAEAGQASAILNAAAAEYALRHEKPEEFKEAQARLNAARRDLQNQPPSPGRNAVAAELAFTVLLFSGTNEQVKEQLRYRWQPSTDANSLKLNERGHTIHQELTTTLQLLQSADFEFRLLTARRLTRELIKHGQAGLAADLLPVALFSDAESYEGRAAIALEIYRAEKGSPLPKKIADDLKAAFTGPGGVKGTPFPTSAHALFSLLGTEKAPTLVTPPASRGPISTDATVLAFVGLWMLEGKTEAALDLANRATAPTTQLRAMTLCADWASDPGPVLEEAAKALERVKLQKSTTQPAALIYQLSRIAAATGKDDRAKTFADAIADEGLKAWARGDCVRLKIVGSPDQKAEDAWVEVPDDSKKVRAGHAWGRLWIARQNARLSQNREAEKKATLLWPPTVQPFALAGIALGLQDR